jgi:glyoxylase-like metal-dependent hydrolase (beta-lactamase superfamily II)
VSVVEVTGILQKQAWRDRVLPPVEQVRPGLWSVPVPIPRNPLRYVLCYVFETGSGLVLVDPGWPAADSWNALVAGLASIGAQVADIHAVLVTHAHIDHHGLANQVRERSGCWVAMHPAEERHIATIRNVRAAAALNDRWLNRCGVPRADQADLIMAPERVRDLVDIVPDRLLEDGDDAGVPGWQVTALWTPGHTPGHLCYVVGDADVVLTGDHLLPRITPNISSYGDDDDPLDDYLQALDLLRGYHDREALPGHEYRFRGIGDRIDRLQRHHRARLSEVLEQVAGQPGAAVWDIATALAWSRAWAQTTGFLRRAALAETLAHLRSLNRAGLVSSAGSDPERWFPAGQAGQAGVRAGHRAADAAG